MNIKFLVTIHTKNGKLPVITTADRMSEAVSKVILAHEHPFTHIEAVELYPHQEEQFRDELQKGNP